jgi:hypothetical protein
MQICHSRTSEITGALLLPFLFFFLFSFFSSSSFLPGIYNQRFGARLESDGTVTDG